MQRGKSLEKERSQNDPQQMMMRSQKQMRTQQMMMRSQKQTRTQQMMMRSQKQTRTQQMMQRRATSSKGRDQQHEVKPRWLVGACSCGHCQNDQRFCGVQVTQTANARALAAKLAARSWTNKSKNQKESLVQMKRQGKRGG
jgi:hypothetical protein